MTFSGSCATLLRVIAEDGFVHFFGAHAVDDFQRFATIAMEGAQQIARAAVVAATMQYSCASGWRMPRKY